MWNGARSRDVQCGLRTGVIISSMQLTPTPRWPPHEFAKNAGKMGLALETYRERDLDQGQPRLEEQLLRALNAPAEEIFMWAQAGGGSKLRREMHACEAGRSGDVG
jgi:hypothetical protein